MYEHAYCQRYEINRDGSSSEPDLACGGYKSALNELYIRILGFQARSVCQLSRNLVSGGIRAMFKMDDWDSLLECIKLQEASCQTFFDSVKDQSALDAREEHHKQRTSLLLDKLGELNLGIKGIQDKLDEIHVTDEESKCFETLRTSNYLARKDLNPERLSGTCNWFFDHPKYQGWIGHTSTSRLLWVSANPGCGKSVLAKALVDQYDRGSVCYYFFKDDTIITRSAAHAVCAILHQICDLRPDLIRYVLPMHRKNGQKLVDSFEDLWSIFVDITSVKDFGTVVCILDALDECSEDDQKKLLQRLAAISISSTSIKVLITSRPYKSIEAALFHETGLDKNEIRLSGEARAEESLIEKEIDVFIKFKVRAFQKLRKSNDISDDVHEKLQSHLNGIQNRTYLWVSAVFKELEKDIDAPDYILMDIIKALPDSLDKAYENILNKSTKSKKPVLLKVLHTMLAAFRPLSLVEMNLVLSIRDKSSGPKDNGLYSEDSFGKWLRDLCGFFVNIVNNKLYFAHQTAREFLIENDGNQSAVGWKHAFQLTSSHTLLAQICVDYLLLLYDGHRNDSFESYATIHWPEHCQSLEVDQSLAGKVNCFLFQNKSVAPSFVRWTIATNRFKDGYRYSYLEAVLPTDPSPSPLSLACYFGWSSVLIILKTFSDIDWNKKDKEKQTGLHVAMRKGHLELVKLLLTAGADANIGESYGQTALHKAASIENLEIVKLLLTAGADVNLQEHYGQTALHVAVPQGNLEIIEVLLTAGADVNIRDHDGETAFHRAVSKRHLEIVKVLLIAGADVIMRNHRGETALHQAVSKKHLEIVKLLLTAGADVNIRDHHGETALHRAVSIENLEIVKLLLTAGVDANIRDLYGQTALHKAASIENLEIVKLLLTAGADVNLQEDYGETALHMAVPRNLEIVEVLLTAGADVNIRDRDGETALHRAIFKSRLEIVEVLLTAGADFNLQGQDGRTALHLAVSDGRLEIVEVLLTAGADVNLQGRYGTTALHRAVSHGNSEIVKVLLDAGADVNIQDGDGTTALHRAVARHHLEIVKPLSTAGANINIQDRVGDTALRYAGFEGQLEIVKLLLTAGANVNARSDEGSPLHIAEKYDHIEIAETLLAAGAVDSGPSNSS